MTLFKLDPLMLSSVVVTTPAYETASTLFGLRRRDHSTSSGSARKPPGRALIQGPSPARPLPGEAAAEEVEKARGVIPRRLEHTRQRQA